MIADESSYLTQCIRLIEEKVQWGESSFWTNAHFEKLSDEIRLDSGISISTSTLKRIFGKEKTYKERYTPQLATKNALVHFIGYRNWGEFIQENLCATQVSAGTAVQPGPFPVLPTSSPEENVESALLPSHPARSALPAQPWYWMGSLVFGAVIIVVASFIALKSKETDPAAPATFTCENPSGPAPYTAVFSYDITQVNADTVFLQSRDQLIPLPRQKHTITYFFPKPGFTKIHLRAGGKVLKTIPVHVTTRGWNAIINDNVPFRLLPREGQLQITREDARKFGIDPFKEFWAEYHQAQDFGVTGDNFTLEARIKNNADEGGLTCFDSAVRIIGEQNESGNGVSLLGQGCGRFASISFGEKEVGGLTSDLSSLTFDLSEWHTVQIRVRNQQMNLSVDGNPIRQLAYRQPIGKLKDIYFVFKGCGAVDYIKVFDAQNKLVYADEFEEHSSGLLSKRQEVKGQK